MEDRLITLAIHTYQKAQILKTMLESEGIEVYLHNVNLIQPVVSSGVRVRIKESDLPKALKFIEASEIFKEEFTEQKKGKEKKEKKKILIPIDFSSYSNRACALGFNLASEIDAEIVIMHAFFTPFFPSSMGESFAFQTVSEEESILLQSEAIKELKKFEEDIKTKITNGEYPKVKFTTILRSGVPEEEIVNYSNQTKPLLIIMGTRGKNQKDIELIGSVTAEVLDTAKVPLFAIPEDTHFSKFSEVKRIAFGTNLDQKDLVVVDSLFKIFNTYDIEYYLFHITHKREDTWNEIKLAGIKEYFKKQYPEIKINYNIIDGNDFVLNMEKFIRDYKIDIISLSKHKRNIFARLFNPSIARRMLFHTDTPILALHS
ncbi:nucleotide-binding universal stress UspA family protein [Dysgonomonadaceae bacterium PH5-43]|nr:nucleotide-binding universal stress UspA family protein [Dysgonomonadaceae bacterium PH5-43]